MHRDVLNNSQILTFQPQFGINLDNQLQSYENSYVNNIKDICMQTIQNNNNNVNAFDRRLR